MCKHTPLHEQIIHAVKCLHMLPICMRLPILYCVEYSHKCTLYLLTYHVHACSTTATGLLINCPTV